MNHLRLQAAAEQHIPSDRASELARSLAMYDTEDLTALAIRDAIERRRTHFGLALTDAETDELVFALWRQVTL